MTDNDAGEEHDNWDQWYAGSPLYPLLRWSWFPKGDVKDMFITMQDGRDFRVWLSGDWWYWYEALGPDIEVDDHGPFSSWEIAASDCEENHEH